ncbi:MAG: hypothetical protein HY810_03070 [Candidatus Omnitrophica bacterium]|nr:hypothetical protein [Candidatus Omnitrophota bacterium]
MKKERRVEYYLKDDGQFVIKNYDLAKPFASFFPGIAGLFGIPMWVFYVNRCQGVVSFGTENKKCSILEFFPANHAWQFVNMRGFRTFLKISNGKNVEVYEPFQNDIVSESLDLEREMHISSQKFQIRETNHSLGFTIEVDYFALANEPLAALMRKVTIRNNSKKVKKIEVLDGLPQIVPYGVSDRFLKELGRTIEAWMQVSFVTKHKAAYYKLVVDPTDRPQVLYIKGGNFYYNFYGKHNCYKKSGLIVDSKTVFSAISNFDYPQKFYEKDFKFPVEQITRSKTPSAFGFCAENLKPQEELELISLIGYAQDEKHLQQLIDKAHDNEFLNKKCIQYQEEISKIQNNIFTCSGLPVYDLYCQQTYLDNVLRGGLALSINGKDKNHTVHVYSRKHGDLERDYNNFLTEPTYFSQGNGNYRDINQNRRNDVWFNADVKDGNISTFFNLIQLDGFNPLVVFGDFFRLEKEHDFKKLHGLFKNRSDFEKVLKFMRTQFSLGNLFMFLENAQIVLKTDKEKFLKEVLSCCKKQENAEHGDGFWVDHWTYNLDAIEAYLGIYPERLKEVLLEKKEFVFFNNFVKVKNRDEKYVLFEGRVRQYHAVSMEEIEEDSHLSRKISSSDWAVRTENGKGHVYKTTLLVKIICLIANKIASLDPFGSGIEMEANKPGWYDALNGLPGLFGSSVCETIELKRLIDFLMKALNDLKVFGEIFLPEELSRFLREIDCNIVKFLKTKNKGRNLIYWNEVYSLKEDYRRKIKDGISGNEEQMAIPDLLKILERMVIKLDDAIYKAKDKKTGLYHTYYINEVIRFEKIKDEKNKGLKLSKDGLVCIKPKIFKQIPLPLFLEAQVHALRIQGNADKVKEIYINTRKSELYDDKLKMYKVNAPLKELSEEIGRARVFTPGWLENESIWLHMEYKFILELLRCGLHKEFFDEFKNVLIPFQPPERYGRSILENSSFLVSSAFPDKSLHGNGFVARLSGSTAEFINMWLWMNLGQKPFFIDQQGNLVLRFEPVLASWMFTSQKSKAGYYLAEGGKIEIELPKNCYAFKFLGKTLVVYHNEKMKDTFGKNAVKPVEFKLTDFKNKQSVINAQVIPAPFAQQIREGLISRIDIVLK